MKLRLFAQIASLEARARLSYRVDFWINSVLGFGVEILLAWSLWDAIFGASGSATIGGRDFDAMLFYYVAVFLIGRITRGHNNEGIISGDIYEGGLNRYLVFPLDYRWVKYAQVLGALAPVIVQVLLFAVIAVSLFGFSQIASTSLGAVAMAVPAVIVANLLFYLTMFPLQATAFWADNVWSLMVMHRFVSRVLGGFMLPLSVFPGWSRGVLEVLPFRFYYDFPVRVLLGEVGVSEWGMGMALALTWCSLMWAIGTVVWRRGLRQYAGIGI